MPRSIRVACYLLLAPSSLAAQVISKGAMDTVQMTVLGHVALGGYVDAYYGYSTDEPSSGDIPYFVSSNRHNEININLAYVDILYRSNSLRADFIPAFGTYMNSNYASETGSARFILEANAGVRLSEKRKLWFDIGVFTSPFTNESPISKDHLMYTRSFAPEYTPYYISGLRLSAPLTSKLNAFVYLINGWQQIRDSNEGKALATQLEFRPNPSMLFNGNIYLGDERSSLHPEYRLRYLLDLYWVYKPMTGRISATASTYVGWQARDGTSTATWWQANVIGRYQMTKKYSLSGRLEYFDDTDQIMIQPTTSTLSFRSWSAGLCFNVHLWNNAMFRVEGRQFFGPEDVYETQSGTEKSTRSWAIASLSTWF